MLELTYTRPNDLAQLHDELLRAVPSLRPVPGGGPSGYAAAVMSAEASGEDVRLLVPDDTDAGAVDAVVAAHVPQARYAPDDLLARRAPLLRDNRRRADLARLRRSVAAAGTVAALRAATAEVLDFLEREGAQAE